MALKQRIRFCQSFDGARLAYATTGSGPPLVKVGNWLTHLEFDLASPVWGHLVDTLSQDHTVLRYDARGTGLSDWDAALSIDAWVRDLDAVADAAGLRRFALLGISQGASLAVRYAIEHPERVSHLIIHGGFARGRFRRNEPDRREEFEAMCKLAELGWGRDDPTFRQLFTLQFIPGGTPEQQRWFNELERVSTAPRIAAQIMRLFADVDVTDLLPRVRCPTLVLHATRDLRVPFDEGRLIASLVQHARFVPLDSANHLMVEQDQEVRARWIDEVREFFGTPHPDAAPQQLGALTPRERELLELIAQGRDNTQIAAVLGLSDKTVRNHITSIFAKLEVESRAQAIVLARDAGYGRATSAGAAR